MANAIARARRTQSERRAETRAALLRAAVEVIARRGYAAATLAEIAAAAGVSKGAVHYHFAAKHALLEPVLLACAAHLRDVAARAWSDAGAPAERLRAALRAMWRARREGGPEIAALVDLAARAAHDASVRVALAAAHAAAARELAEALASALASTGLRARIPPAELARLVLLTLDGVAATRTFADDGAALDALEALVPFAVTV